MSLRGVRVLVTGAGGFVGGWLTRALLERGAEVVGTRLSAEVPAGGAPDGMRWLAGDVRESVFWSAALDDVQPDAVVHLAGISSVGGAPAGITTRIEPSVASIGA